MTALRLNGGDIYRISLFQIAEACYTRAMQFTGNQEPQRSAFINECQQKAWGAACHADFISKQLDELIAQYAKLKEEDDSLAADIKAAETALDYHTVENRQKRKEKQERRNQLTQIMQALGQNMGAGQKALEQLQANIENNAALATHAESWSWPEQKTDDPEPKTDN
jgi:septal ring factor EnvC (AmiA/AmiB activator)